MGIEKKNEPSEAKKAKARERRAARYAARRGDVPPPTPAPPAQPTNPPKAKKGPSLLQTMRNLSLDGMVQEKTKKKKSQRQRRREWEALSHAEREARRVDRDAGRLFREFGAGGDVPSDDDEDMFGPSGRFYYDADDKFDILATKDWADGSDDDEDCRGGGGGGMTGGVGGGRGAGGVGGVIAAV